MGFMRKIFLRAFLALGLTAGIAHAQAVQVKITVDVAAMTNPDCWLNQGTVGRGGKVYATSLAVLALSVKNHFLPIYQR